MTAAEDAALSRLCEVLPDDAVSRAWTNLAFTDLDGRIHEIDALVLTKVGVFVVELRGWHGTIAGTSRRGPTPRRAAPSARSATRSTSRTARPSACAAS